MTKRKGQPADFSWDEEYGETVAEQLAIEHGRVRFVMMGPRAAAHVLACNYERQRPHRTKHILMLTAAIQKGLWVCNGDPIIISDTGKLLNGQNRAMAIVEAKMAVQVVLIEGMSEAAFGAIDCLRFDRTLAFRLGISERMARDLAFVNSAIRGQRERAQSSDLEDLMVWWNPIYNALASVLPPGSKTKHHTGVLRLAAGMRWAIASTHEERSYVLDQFSAVARQDYVELSPASSLLSKAIGKWGASMNHQENMRRAAIAFAHFDPMRRDHKQVRGPWDAQEIAQWVRVADSAFLEERIANVHPFRFTSAPVIDTEMRRGSRSGRGKPQQEDRPTA